MSDRNKYLRLLAGLNEKERELLDLLHCLYERGRFAVSCRELMEDLGIDYEQYTAIAEKMHALHVADWSVSQKRATPEYGGLYIKPGVKRVWQDLCQRRKMQMGGEPEWGNE